MGVLVRQVKGKTGWWVIATHNKKRKTWKFNDKRAALAHAKEHERLLALRVANPTSGLTLSEYFDRWITEHIEAQRKGATLDQYRIAYQRYIKPTLGTRNLDSITRSDIRTLLAVMRADKKSTATMRAYLAPLSAMFNQAIEDELVSKNPVFRQLPIARYGLQNPVAKVLKRDELETLLTVCRKRYAPHYPFVLALARTGMRVGEATALRWPEVDLTNGNILVRRTHRESKWKREAEDLAYAPKSGKYRSIPMSNELHETLRLWHAARNKDNPRVFSSKNGGLVDLANFRKRAWTRMLREAEVPHIRLHDMRHTVATLLLEANVPLIKVKEILGHHSIKVTADLYGHLDAGKYKDEVNTLDSNARGEHDAHEDAEVVAGLSSKKK